jgi:hypothetical protein
MRASSAMDEGVNAKGLSKAATEAKRAHAEI